MKRNSLILVPQYSFRAVTDISPDFLNALGVKLLMLDLDNTIAAYSEHLPSDGVMKWLEELRNCGITLYIVSNSVRHGRVEAFAQALRIGFMKGASKPSPKGVFQTIEITGFKASESAFVGDQIYTDTIAANRAGVISIVVKPRRFTNPFLAVRYVLESPFRAICKNRIRN